MALAHSIDPKHDLDLEFPEFEGEPLPALRLTNDQYLEFIELNRQATAANHRPIQRSQPVDDMFRLD